MKYIRLALIAFTAAILASSCSKPDNSTPTPGPTPGPNPGPTPDPVSYDYIENGVNLGKGIAILGDWDKKDSTPDTELYWAPVNCGYEATGEVNTISDHRLGLLYQWGYGDVSLYKDKGETVMALAMYYDTPTPEKWLDSEICGAASDKWNKNQGPCPDGWRLPTSKEFEVLCAGKNSELGWVEKGTYAGQVNAYSGAEFFGANPDKTPGKGVFFPACGDRSSLNGNPSGRTFECFYWSSTTHSVATFAYAMEVSSFEMNPFRGYGRSFGFAVRCVK